MRQALFGGAAPPPLRLSCRVLDGGIFTARNSIFVFSNWVLLKVLYIERINYGVTTHNR